MKFLGKRRFTTKHSAHAVVFLSLPSSWRPLLSFLSQSTCRGICRIKCNHKQLSQLLRSIGGHEALMSRHKHELTCLLCLLAECQHLAEKQKKTKRVKLRVNRHHFLQGCTPLPPPLWFVVTRFCGLSCVQEVCCGFPLKFYFRHKG